MGECGWELEDSTALINSLSMLDANVLITNLSMPGDKYGMASP